MFRKQIDIEAIKSRLDYDPETGVFRNKDGSLAGSKSHYGYWRVRANNQQYYAHVVAWAIVHGVLPDGDIDHKNGVKTDNRICNLRVATRSENQRNHGLTKANRSGMKGAFRGPNGSWKSLIRVNGKQIYLGKFSTKDDAAKAYDAASRKLHGEFSYLKGVAA